MKFSEPSTVALSKTRRASSYQQRLGSFRSLTLDRVGSSVHSTTAISCFSNQTSVISSTSLPSTKKLVPAGTAPILNDRRWDLCRSNARPMLRGLGPGRALCLDRLSTVDVWHLWADKRRGPVSPNRNPWVGAGNRTNHQNRERSSVPRGSAFSVNTWSQSVRFLAKTILRDRDRPCPVYYVNLSYSS